MTCVVHFDVNETVVFVVEFGVDGHFALRSMLQGVVDQIAQQYLSQLPVPHYLEGGWVENQVYIVVKPCAGAGHAVEDFVQREYRWLELKSAGDGQVGPVFDVGKGAQQLVKHFLSHLRTQFFILQVGEEWVDIVPHDREAGLYVGNTLHVLTFGLL